METWEFDRRCEPCPRALGFESFFADPSLLFPGLSSRGLALSTLLFSFCCSLRLGQCRPALRLLSGHPYPVSLYSVTPLLLLAMTLLEIPPSCDEHRNPPSRFLAFAHMPSSDRPSPEKQLKREGKNPRKKQKDIIHQRSGWVLDLFELDGADCSSTAPDAPDVAGSSFIDRPASMAPKSAPCTTSRGLKHTVLMGSVGDGLHRQGRGDVRSASSSSLLTPSSSHRFIISSNLAMSSVVWSSLSRSAIKLDRCSFVRSDETSSVSDASSERGREEDEAGRSVRR